MKNETTRTKTLSGFSSRAIALVLCFVMLLTAIGSGSVLSAIAADFEGNGAAVLVDAAKAGADVDAPALDEAAAEDKASDEPFVDDIEDGYDIKSGTYPGDINPLAKKADSELADTGRDADIAETGNGFQGGKIIYFVNTNAWSNVYIHAWGSNWHNHETMTRIGTSGVYKWQNGSNDYTCDGFNFMDSSTAQSGGTNAFYDWVTNDKVYWPNSASDTTTELNGTANVISMIATTNGGSYSKTSSTYCKATISGYNISGGSSSATSDVTGSKNTATIYPAYATTVSYSAVASGSYVFKGFSTTNSSSLPSDVTNTKTQTSYYHPGNKTNVSDVYAYFEKKPSYTATISSDGGTVGTEKSAVAHISTSSTEGTATSQTVTSGTTLYVYTHQNSGYIPTVSVNDGAVSVTKVSNTKYSFSMPSGAADVAITYAPATYKTVKVYAGTGGSVTVKYNNKTAASVAAGENSTVYVYEGDSITLTATAASGNTFTTWKKNLNDSYSTTNPQTETINDDTVYVARFSASTTSGWLYSGTAAASRTEVTPTSGMSSFSGVGTTYNAFRFMYGTTDTGLTNALTPSYYDRPGSGGYPYWAEITSAMNETTGNFFIGLCNYENKGNLVGNNSEEVNDTTTSTQEIKDTAGNTLFKLQIKQNNDVSSSAKYVLVYSVDWNRVSAIGVKAYDNSKSTNSNNSHSGKVDYQFYYKAKSGSTNDTSYTPSVTYYAKDSALKGTASNPYFTTSTSVTAVSNKVTASDKGTYVTGKALKGSQITVSTIISGYVKTTSDNSTYTNSTVTARSKYYVVGYSFNGETPQILTPDTSTGKYTCTYTIPEDMTADYLEITPIYWLIDNSNCTTFYVKGFENLTSVQSDWGNTLYIYPFYATTSSKYNGKDPGHGVYPGQPMVKHGGYLYSQIALTEDGIAGGKTIKGITINNGQQDDIHGSSSYCGVVSIHRQTYDYDDFYKIANEKKFKADGVTKNLESIFFTFKYFAESTTKQHRLYSTTSNAAKDTRYNDTLADSRLGNSTSAHNTTVTEANLNDYATDSNGWERLTDPLDNQVDIFGNKVTDTTQRPLKVISLGYEYNNAGQYATEWSIYHYNTSTSRYDLIYDSGNHLTGGDSGSLADITTNSSIVPSALVMNSKSSFSKYPGLDGDVSMVNYQYIYDNLSDYAGLPVEICYEHEAKIKTNSAYRCDGRWNYTTVDDYVQSDIMIEYVDKNGVTKTDTFGTDSHVGENTGCSAYFLNGDYSGATVSKTEPISEADADRYQYTAVAAGNYEFVGWDRIDKGDTTGKSRTTVTSNATAYTKRSQNSTFIAKFKYVATGNLTVSHNAAVAGTANTYIGVYLVDSNGDEIATIANASNTASVKLDKSYITTDNANAGNKLKIVLRTEPLGENTFSTYTCTRVDGSDNSATTTDSNYYSSGANLTTATTILVPFNGGIFSSGSQITKALTYTSTLSGATYKYNVKFHYSSRYFGEQAFTKTGTLNSTQTALGDENAVIVGTVGQADKTLKTSFLTRIKPHESSFNKSINWDFENGVTQYCVYSGVATNTYTINVVVTNTVETEAVTRTGYFTVPYELDIAANKTKNYKEYTLNGDGVSYGLLSAAENTFNVTTSYDEYFKDDAGSTITAPAVLLSAAGSDSGKQYFQYWKIETTGSTSQGVRREIGRCYFPAFNYRAFDNYYVTAVYTTDPEKNYSALYADSSAESTSVAYIGSSRNQWNTASVSTSASATDTTGKGSATAASGDILYNDFILSFKPANDKLIKDISGAEYGIILQRLTQVKLTNGAVTATIADYETANKSTESTAYTNATNVANGTKVTGFIKKQLNTGDNAANNKNRMHYVYEVSNSAEGNATYLFRAYSYMKYDGKTVVSEKPTYFYMRDIASVQ